MACPAGIDVWVFSLDVADRRDAIVARHSTGAAAPSGSTDAVPDLRV